MQWIGLGKVTVATSGTPVPLSTTQSKCNQVWFSFDPTDTTAIIYVKDPSGNKMAALSSSSVQPTIFGGPGENILDLRNFYVDSSANGKGPIVAYGVS